MTAVQRNHVKVIGRGKKTLIFAHGYGCDQSMWRAVTPAFEDKYKIVLFDYWTSQRPEERLFAFRSLVCKVVGSRVH